MFKELQKSMTSAQVNREDAIKNIKNGYLALGGMFLTTVVGYGVGLSILPTLLASLTGFFGMLVFFGVMIGMIFAIHAFKNSVVGLVLLLAFGLLQGIFITPLIAASTSSAVFGALAGTIVLTLGTSYVAWTGKVDSSSWGKYLFIALVALIVGMVVNIFIGSSALQILISSAVIVVMSGFMVYDTQRALENPTESYITVALSFYLNIINIFIHLLSILGLSDD